MKLGIALACQESIPGEAFGFHLSTIGEASRLCPFKEEDGKVTSGVVTITPVGLTPHDAVRVAQLKAALDAGCDRLFVMDDDTITPRGGLTKLMKEMDERQCQAISGFYVRRGPPYISVWACDRPEDKDVEKKTKFYQVHAEGGVHVIHMTGFGCCLIDLKWVDKNVQRPWFKMDQSEEKTEVTDDLVFFRQFKKAGGVLLGDGDVQCTHLGSREWINVKTAALLNAYRKELDEFVGRGGV